METYQIKIQDFEGPLDLLLHLIKEKEMDLETLNLASVADQYLTYIRHVSSYHLEVASEYLVMASYLIELKSKLLLPKEKVEIEENYEEDPREQLIRRLIEYKKYKDVLEDFKEAYEKRKEIHLRIPSSMNEYVVDTTHQIPEDLEIYDLIRAMQKMYQRKHLLKPMETSLARQEISIDERSTEIRQFFKLHRHRKIKLEELFDREGKNFFIVTFLSVLDLVNKKEITIQQDHYLDEIYLEVI